MASNTPIDRFCIYDLGLCQCNWTWHDSDICFTCQPGIFLNFNLVVRLWISYNLPICHYDLGCDRWPKRLKVMNYLRVTTSMSLNSRPCNFFFFCWLLTWCTTKALNVQVFMTIRYCDLPDNTIINASCIQYDLDLPDSMTSTSVPSLTSHSEVINLQNIGIWLVMAEQKDLVL